jgi:hypothetical protein
MAYYQDFQGGYYMTTPARDAAFSNVGESAEAGVMDADGHLAAEDLYGVQKNTFVATIKGSLEEFANNPDKAVWSIPPEAHRFLQKVTSQVDRSKPTSENLVGDLGRTILLKATVKEVRNQFPIDIGLDIQGLVPTQLTSAGRHNYVIFADTKPSLVNQDIFEPNSIFTKDAYIKYQRLSFFCEF